MSKNFFSVEEEYREKFYQLPKVFFTNDEYKKLTNDTKIAYAILQDRLSLSIKNKWFDEEGNIYFIYSNEKLMDILNCGKEKLAKIKKSLEKADLLTQKRRGCNKTNILYLMKPVITKDDIYEIEKEENDTDTYRDKDVRKSNNQKFENRTSRSTEIERQEVRKSNTNDTELNDNDLNDIEYNTTTTQNEISRKTEKESNQKSSGRGSYNEYLFTTLKKELNIGLTSKYKKTLKNLTDGFDNDVIIYAIQYTATYANNHKQYLLKILENWKEAKIETLEQAKNYTHYKRKSQNKLSREMTPKWLEERDNSNELNKKQKEYDKNLAADREAFLKKLRANKN